MRPATLSPEKYLEIYQFHSATFHISQDITMQALQKRHVIHLYYDKKTHQLMGTIAFQWDEIDDAVYMYIGSVVIDPRHQKSGLLTHSLLNTITYTFLHYPLKKKYAIACATTPQAYKYFTHLKEYWPRNDKATPDIIIQTMKRYLEKNHIDHYDIHDGAVINNDMLDKIIEINPIDIHDQKVKLYYEKMNPQSAKGAQLLCLTPFSLGNFVSFIWPAIKKSLMQIFNAIKRHVYLLSTLMAGIFLLLILDFSLESENIAAITS